jgi:hypothetical protein
VKFSVCPSILLNNKEYSSLGNFTPRGPISPLVDKFIPRGEIHPWGPGVKLRMALCDRCIHNFNTSVVVYVLERFEAKINYFSFLKRHCPRSRLNDPCAKP